MHNRPAVAAAFAVALWSFPPDATAQDWTGSFAGASGHQTGGTVTVSRSGDGFVVTLEDDFAFDGAPDPRLGFGDGDTVAGEAVFTRLQRNTGKQSYRLPASIDPAGFSTFYLWCEQFGVPLGRAPLARR